jgi:hypothetical protein
MDESNKPAGRREHLHVNPLLIRMYRSMQDRMGTYGQSVDDLNCLTHRIYLFVHGRVSGCGECHKRYENSRRLPPLSPSSREIQSLKLRQKV